MVLPFKVQWRCNEIPFFATNAHISGSLNWQIFNEKAIAKQGTRFISVRSAQAPAVFGNFIDGVRSVWPGSIIKHTIPSTSS